MKVFRNALPRRSGLVPFIILVRKVRDLEKTLTPLNDKTRWDSELILTGLINPHPFSLLTTGRTEGFGGVPTPGGAVQSIPVTSVETGTRLRARLPNERPNMLRFKIHGLQSRHIVGEDIAGGKIISEKISRLRPFMRQTREETPKKTTERGVITMPYGVSKVPALSATNFNFEGVELPTPVSNKMADVSRSRE